MSSKEAALRFAKKGWEVLPVHSVQPNGFCSCGATSDYSTHPKHAIGKHPYHGELGHRFSSSNELDIHTWFVQWPDCNLAIATGAKSGLIVIDVDKKNGGLESLDFLWKAHGKFPKTPMVRSGGGGAHFYFKHPGFEVRGRRNMQPGIDVMADGGRIVAPPSIHKNGTKYVWDEQYDEETPVADLPTWLLRMILSKQSKRKRSEEVSEEVVAEAPAYKEPKIFRNSSFRF